MSGMEKERIKELESAEDTTAQGGDKACEAIGARAVDAYHRIENTVVGGYQKMEDAVVGGYRRIEHAFVEKFFAKEGEAPEDAKARMAKEQAEREEKMRADMEKRAAEQQEIIDRANRISR